MLYYTAYGNYTTIFNIAQFLFECLAGKPVRNQEEQIVTGHAEKVSLLPAQYSTVQYSTVHTHARTHARCFGQMNFSVGP